MPSEQLVHYLTLRGEGCSVATAADESGIGEAEAWLHEEDVQRGELKFIEPSCARVHEAQPKETVKMAHGQVAADELRLLVERVERLAEERKNIADDISGVFKEAKSRGFDTNAMKCVIKLRKMETHTLHEAEAIVAVYLDALGMTPIENAIATALAA